MTELFASVKRLIRRDEIEKERDKALPLPPPKFGKWHKKKKRTRLADCDDAIAELIGDVDAAQTQTEES